MIPPDKNHIKIIEDKLVRYIIEDYICVINL